MTGDTEGDPGDEADRLKRQIAVNNEKAKLSATALNNVAVTLFAGGTVLPIVALSFPLATAPPRLHVDRHRCLGSRGCGTTWVGKNGAERNPLMETHHLLLFLPPGLALIWAFFIVRAVRKSAAEVDAARDALRRRPSHAAE